MNPLAPPAVRRFGFSRRRFFAAALLCAPFAVAADAAWVEPKWVKTRRLKLCKDIPKTRFIHFTDLHHKGDRSYLLSIVDKINALSPDFVCFTGDLIEDGMHLPEALELLRKIKSPIYGVPGNHDYWAKVEFGSIGECFASNGGAFMLDERVPTKDGKFMIVGASSISFRGEPKGPVAGTKSILLMHYPAWVNKLAGRSYDLILAGHSHGGQIRIPFYGPIFVPFGVEQYDMGWFETNSGPLYVNPGLGWFPVPIRFNCRPELTVFEI
jgi:predicted MPP superfamily phosphohydrolase